MITVLEGESFKEFKDKFDGVPVYFYDNSNSRFSRDPERTIILNKDTITPKFCSIDFQCKGSYSEFRFGKYWMDLTKESSCSIY